MHIHALRIKNFRRLRDVQIDLNSDISIFVGANNSGKGSVALSAKCIFRMSWHAIPLN